MQAPSGGHWHVGSVKSILRNSVYTGTGIANRLAAGLYSNRAPGMPVESKTTVRDLATRKARKAKLRPTKDWLSIPQPALTEFLPPDIRAMAIEWQNQPWSCKAEQAANPIPVPDRHIDSSYLLKGILVSSQGQMPMSGKTCGPKGKRKRYYAVTRSIRCPNSGEAVLMVPAASIEQLVLQVLQQVLLVAPNLKEILRKQVTRQFASDQLSQDGHADLKERHRKIGNQRTFILDNLESIGEDQAKIRLLKLAAEAAEIQRQIGASQSACNWDVGRIGPTVDTVVNELGKSADALRTLSAVTIRRMLQLLIRKGVVDLESRSVEIEFSLPKWAFEQPEALKKALCPEDISARKCILEAQTEDSIPLVRFRVYWLGNRQGYVGYGIAA
jgi:hypothetical protein